MGPVRPSKEPGSTVVLRPGSTSKGKTRGPARRLSRLDGRSSRVVDVRSSRVVDVRSSWLVSASTSGRPGSSTSVRTGSSQRGGGGRPGPFWARPGIIATKSSGRPLVPARRCTNTMYQPSSSSARVGRGGGEGGGKEIPTLSRRCKKNSTGTCAHARVFSSVAEKFQL